MTTNKPARGGEPVRGRPSQTATADQSVSAAVWAYLEQQPGFSDAIDRGERELAEGKSVRFKEIRGGR